MRSSRWVSMVVGMAAAMAAATLALGAAPAMASGGSSGGGGGGAGGGGGGGCQPISNPNASTASLPGQATVRVSASETLVNCFRSREVPLVSVTWTNLTDPANPVVERSQNAPFAYYNAGATTFNDDLAAPSTPYRVTIFAKGTDGTIIQQWTKDLTSAA